MSDTDSIKDEKIVYNPYNSKNKLVTVQDIENILKRNGVTLPIKNLSFYQEAFVHKSFRPSEIDNKQNISSGIMITRNTKKSLIMFYSAYVGDDFRSDLGYYRRYGMYKFEPNYRFRIYPKNPKIQEIELSHYAAWVFRTELENKYEGNIHYSQIQLKYLSTSRLSFQRRQSKTYLYYDFDPTRSLSGKPLPKNNFYDYVNYIISYKSSSREISNL